MARRVRGAVRGAAAAALLAGCAAFQPMPQRDPATCERLFRDYDQATRIWSPYPFSGNDEETLILSPEYSRRANRLLVADCLTSSDELADLDALRVEIGHTRPLNSGAAITPVAVHVGVVGGITDEVAVLQFFRALGFRARSIGGEGLGRRIYVGPLQTEGAVADAIAIGRRAGFVSPYVSDVFSFGLIPSLL